MSASRHTVSNGGAALIADADPNVTAPSEARLFTMQRSPVGAIGWWHAAEAGAVSFELWARLTPSKWFKLSVGGATVFVAAVNTATVVDVAVTDAPLFARVTVPGTCTALHIGASR